MLTKGKQRFKLKMPGAFVILFILTIVAVVATWVVPSGSYAKLAYNQANSSLQVKQPNGQVEKVPATQKELDKLGVKINIQKFTSGSINQEISIPNTYERLKQHPAGVDQITSSMVNGTIEAVDIMVFIFVLGGLIGVVRASGAFESGLLALTKKTKGHEFLLIFLVATLMVLGGTLCGIEEEAVAFYPILVPVFIAMGYDSIVCVGAIFLASSIGTAFSTINPFSVVIASNAAGISFTEGLPWRAFGCVVAALFVIGYLYWYSKKVKQNPAASYSYEDRDEFNQKWSVINNDEQQAAFTLRKKIVLALFVAGFPLMVWGVMTQGWWFPKMAASFLAFAILIMILTATGKNGIGEKGVVDAFVNGASSLVGVSLIIGLARGIIAKPDLLLLDEPFSALDFMTRSRLQMDFSKIQDELGMTMVLITHDVNEAVLLSDKTVFLEEGKVKQEVNIALPKPRRFGDQNLLPFQQTLFNFFLT